MCDHSAPSNPKSTLILGVSADFCSVACHRMGEGQIHLPQGRVICSGIGFIINISLSHEAVFNVLLFHSLLIKSFYQLCCSQPHAEGQQGEQYHFLLIKKPIVFIALIVI